MRFNDVLARSRSLLLSHLGFACILLVVAGFLLGIFVQSDHEPAASESSQMTSMHSEDAQDQATMWTCAMHPQIRSSKPGKCPICGMDLIPVAKTGGGMRTLILSPEARALMNIETAPVERRYVKHAVRLVGKVNYDETKLGYITAWVAGRLDRLYVDYTGVEVKQGDHMVYIYSEQLYAAQDELIQALKYSRQTPANSDRIGVPAVNLVHSAREKLRLLGLTEDQIKQIESRSTPSDHLTIYSPVSGIVIDKLKQEGERVNVGDRIYTIADLSLVWVHLDAYESDLPWIRYGQDVTITTDAYPGEEFHGRIAFIQPVLNDRTRTVKVRVNVPNPDGRLKPEMFVHATVEPTVAAGGRVMDPSLAGKWICPMHPEVVRDAPGQCPICGMDLVTAESLGYVTPDSDLQQPPLVIPYLAALVTGTRAVVYVELPSMHSQAEPALRTLSTVVAEGDLDKVRAAFGTYAKMLDQPYDQPGTDYARRTWNELADRLSQAALAGEHASSLEEAESALARIDSTMNEAREQFAPPDHPTYEGREIVLGSRAGDYYLVRHGLEEGELVVKQGNFKIDSEIQIEAKPSMMTPEGGGGSMGHHHGGGAMPQAGGGEQAEHQMTIPPEFTDGLHRLDELYDQVADAVRQRDLDEATAAFAEFSEALDKLDAATLTGHAHMLWRELDMLLGNDAAEGSDTKQMDEASRVFLVLKGHMRRLREQFGISPAEQPPEHLLAVSKEFQLDLGDVWQQYQAIAEALATDNADEAKQYASSFRSALDSVDPDTLSEDAKSKWSTWRTGLEANLVQLEQAPDIKAMRTDFAAVSQQIGSMIRTFGLTEVGSIYELHCPMALGGAGAFWYQAADEVRNPYFGSAMLSCADRVERIPEAEPTVPEPQHGPLNHTQQ